MNPEYVNLFECSNCDYWEEQPADQQLHHMGAILIETKYDDDKFGLYECPSCKTQTWSFVIPKD